MPKTAAAIIRVTGGNFRLLDRLLTQMGRIMRINNMAQMTNGVVEAGLGREWAGDVIPARPQRPPLLHPPLRYVGQCLEETKACNVTLRIIWHKILLDIFR
jgi:hypothetical protein